MVGDFVEELQIQIIMKVERNTWTETVGCCETAKGNNCGKLFLK
jgi:hypothetical protein